MLGRYYLSFVFQGCNLLNRTTALENVELPYRDYQYSIQYYTHIDLAFRDGTIALGVPFIIDISVILLAFGFSTAVGIVFGYFPARKAARLDPIDALHHE